MKTREKFGTSLAKSDPSDLRIGHKTCSLSMTMSFVAVFHNSSILFDRCRKTSEFPTFQAKHGSILCSPGSAEFLHSQQRGTSAAAHVAEPQRIDSCHGRATQPSGQEKPRQDFEPERTGTGTLICCLAGKSTGKSKSNCSLEESTL